MSDKKIPLLVVCGPTASGKTSAGVALAKEYRGEVVSADSMQIYKGLDIATAKPTKEETDGIPHHLINVVDIGESFSVADYIVLAKQKISDIVERGKLPVLVGGSVCTSILLSTTLILILPRPTALCAGGLSKRLRHWGTKQCMKGCAQWIRKRLMLFRAKIQ